MSEQDPTEELRRAMSHEINYKLAERPHLEALYGQVWDHLEMPKDFIVTSFFAPFCFVKRLSDGQEGTLMFQHHPRYYFKFEPT